MAPVADPDTRNDSNNLDELAEPTRTVPTPSDWYSKYVALGSKMWKQLDSLDGAHA